MGIRENQLENEVRYICLFQVSIFLKRRKKKYSAVSHAALPKPYRLVTTVGQSPEPRPYGLNLDKEIGHNSR